MGEGLGDPMWDLHRPLSDPLTDLPFPPHPEPY